MVSPRAPSILYSAGRYARASDNKLKLVTAGALELVSLHSYTQVIISIRAVDSAIIPVMTILHIVHTCPHRATGACRLFDAQIVYISLFKPAGGAHCIPVKAKWNFRAMQGTSPDRKP